MHINADPQDVRRGDGQAASRMMNDFVNGLDMVLDHMGMISAREQLESTSQPTSVTSRLSSSFMLPAPRA